MSTAQLYGLIVALVLVLCFVIYFAWNERKGKKAYKKKVTAELDKRYRIQHELDKALEEVKELKVELITQGEPVTTALETTVTDSNYIHVKHVLAAAAKIQRTHGPKARDTFKKLFPEIF